MTPSNVMAGSDEQKFLEASLSYAAGKPILNDQEFDDLKMRLKVIHLYFVGSDNVFIILEFFLCDPGVEVGSLSHLGHG